MASGLDSGSVDTEFNYFESKKSNCDGFSFQFGLNKLLCQIWFLKLTNL